MSDLTLRLYTLARLERARRAASPASRAAVASSRPQSATVYPSHGEGRLVSASPTPISLTDDQLNRLMIVVGPLHPVEREPFLRALAILMSGRGEIGDGEFYRVLRELQRQHVNPPDDRT